MTSRAAVDAFVQQPALALAGLSRNGKKFGNLALRELRAKGYTVYPVHPTAERIDGVECYRSFRHIPARVDAVLVVVPPKQALEVVRDAAAAGIHHVWLQQGAESADVLALCRELGLSVVSGECILMFTHPTGIHKAHGWLWRLLGRMPHAAA